MSRLSGVLKSSSLVLERAAGVLLVVVGVLVATNYYIVLNSWTVSLTPDWLLKRL